MAGFLASLRDWALSRDRYWGTPLNLWVCADCGKVTSVGSRQDMVARAVDADSAQRVELHRPYIDEVKLVCDACGGHADRVPYVIDTWFDSGSMHSAQWHYPFENEEKFKENFPADFICEAMEQTRGWFYTLLATSTIIHGVAPFRNCMGTGLGLDENGLKMSKSKGNVVDPWEAIEPYGADCLRWYLYSSSSPWKSKRLGDADIKEPLYRFLDTIRNTYDFFALYASIDGYDPDVHSVDPASLTLLDTWVMSRLASTARTVNQALDSYDVISATEAMETLVSDLSNWYVRLSRRRFWRGGMGPDKIAAYATLREVLVEISKLLAPFIPFLSEAVYRLLRTSDSPESVHLCAFPQVQEAQIDELLERDMAGVRQVVALGHQARNQAQIKVRQPLARAIIERDAGQPMSEQLVQLICTELNVETVEIRTTLDELFEDSPMPNFRTLGPRLGSQGKAAGDWIRQQSAEDIASWFAEGSHTVVLNGASVELKAEDIVYEKVMPSHLVLSEEAGNRILLDTALDERLRRKGLVRELTHRIQMARKNADFDVTDRIDVMYCADESLQTLVAAHRAEIAEEILAVSVQQAEVATGEYTETIEFDGMSITVALTRRIEQAAAEEE